MRMLSITCNPDHEVHAREWIKSQGFKLFKIREARDEFFRSKVLNVEIIFSISDDEHVTMLALQYPHGELKIFNWI
jgi:hypothetical protein